MSWSAIWRSPVTGRTDGAPSHRHGGGGVPRGAPAWRSRSAATGLASRSWRITGPWRSSMRARGSPTAGLKRPSPPWRPSGGRGDVAPEHVPLGDPSSTHLDDMVVEVPAMVPWGRGLAAGGACKPPSIPSHSSRSLYDSNRSRRIVQCRKWSQTATFTAKDINSDRANDYIPGWL